MLDENEEEQSKRSKYQENKKTESNQKIEKIKKSLTENEQNLLAEIGIKEIKNTNDPTKLSLRERLALRVAKGNLTTLNRRENKENTVTINNVNLNEDLDIKEVEEMLDNDFLGKKKKPNTQKNLNNQKEGKTSTKKKKVIDDGDDDLFDEDFKL